MKDIDRLAKLIAKLQTVEGISEAQYTSIASSLGFENNQTGVDEDGRVKIAMFDAKSYDTDSFTNENKHRFTILPIPAKLDANSLVLAKGCKIVCIFVNDCCDAQVIEDLAGIGVELIALRCAGFNNVDLTAAKIHKIDVVRVPAYSPYAVAEHTVALMLMLNRKLHRAYLRNREGQFVLDGLVGFDMHGKTVGVIGTGKIGQCVIDILTGFGCHILAFDKFPNEKLLSQKNVNYVDMQTLTEQSDIVTLHAPLTEDTQHIINHESISKMKQGVMLINTSRGALIDTVALIAGLKSGHVSSAGLDVYEEEADIFFKDMSGQIIKDEVFVRLLTFSNVVVTSHQGFLTKEALSNIAETTLSNVQEFVDGKRSNDLTHAVVVQ
jgi:D-lactate dehydrogenase